MVEASLLQVAEPSSVYRQKATKKKKKKVASGCRSGAGDRENILSDITGTQDVMHLSTEHQPGGNPSVTCGL